MELIQFDHIQQALSEATTIDEIHNGRDKLEALRYYVRQQRLGYEVEYKLAVAKLDYERKGGEILGGMALHGGDRKSKSQSDTLKLADYGISKSQSSRWQKEASVSEDKYLSYLSKCLDKEEIPTSNGLLKLFKEVRREKERQEQIEAIEEIEANPQNVTYHVIVVDPPWSYKKRPTDVTHRAANPYPSMTVEELMEIVLPSQDDCILWLWTTNAFMVEAHQLASHWGFEVKTILTWVKDRMGLGDWLRGKTEHCLMCIKGKPVVNLTNQTTVIDGPLREHSRKPDSFYELVNELCIGMKAELFARQEREGWYSYGNETDRFTHLQEG